MWNRGNREDVLYQSCVAVDVCTWNMNVQTLPCLSSYDRLDNCTPLKDSCQLSWRPRGWSILDRSHPHSVTSVLENTEQLAPKVELKVRFQFCRNTDRQLRSGFVT